VKQWNEFVVYGMPVPQPRPRISMAGGFARAYTPADHPVIAYRSAIERAALSVHARREWRRRLGSRVRLEVWCVFQRPKSHLKADGSTRKDAPPVPRPDVDNVLKSVMDAMTSAGVWGDDVVVVSARVRKRYVGSRIAPHTVIRAR
jgi:Holliday junction resolvase RusA-like endonuclease